MKNIYSIIGASQKTAINEKENVLFYQDNININKYE